MSGTYERELVNALDKAGFGVMRAPSSGSSTERDLPDVIVGRPVGQYSEVWVIEHKSGKAPTLYIDQQEVEDLFVFANRFGATPLLGARSTRRVTPTDHFLVHPDDARQTELGNYGISFVDVDELYEQAFAIVSPSNGRVNLRK